MQLSERQKSLKKPDYTQSIYKKNFSPAPELKEYLNYRRSARFSDSYTDSIGYSVSMFIRFLGRNKMLSEVSSNDLDLFVKFLGERDYKTSTIRLYVTHIHGFMQYLRVTGRLASVPRHNFPIRMTEEEKLEDVRYLTQDEVIKIRQSAAKAPHPTQPLRNAVRHKLVVELLISTGMRKSELPTILISNIDLVSMNVKIFGRKNSHTRRSKGKSGWRIVPLTGMSSTYIKEWLSLRAEQDAKELLPGIRSRDADYIVQKVCLRAKLFKEGTKRSWVTPHKFRHHFATTLFEKGVDIGIIADQMGDEIKTLDAYIHSDRSHDTQYLGSLME